MAYTQLTLRHTPSARVEKISDDSSHYRLSIPSGFSDSYRLAQLDDYSGLLRKKFPHHSLTLSLSARTSSDSIAGTWGFGLWNDPFGLSLGFGGTPFRLPMLSNAAWFFGASEENYLSFREPAGFDTGRNSAVPTRPAIAANGFIAQTFRSPRFHPLLILAGLALPFSRKTTRRMLSRVVVEDGIVLRASSALETAEYAREKDYASLHSRRAQTSEEKRVNVKPSQWHRYRLEWSLKRVVWEVDDVQVFVSAVSPNPPLGLVVWIDNQYAAFTPEGKIGFGVLANPEPAWLEVQDVEATPL
jgi:hypothetical protein